MMTWWPWRRARQPVSSPQDERLKEDLRIRADALERQLMEKALEIQRQILFGPTLPERRREPR